jgi:hypothetical protein
MKVMYTFRFNPIFQQWVILGEPIPQALIIQDAHKIVPNLASAPDFQAATYPRQPFVIEPESTKKHEDELLFAPQSPVGEYELILYTGTVQFFEWSSKEWSQWLLLAAERFRAIHLNPHLHFAILKVLTKGLHSAGEEYMRVGDFIATSHPLAGMSLPVSHEIITKLIEKEKLFVVRHDEYGALYVPTAPLNVHEVWYLPRHTETFDAMTSAARTSLAKTLAAAFAALHEEFPEEHWCMTLHTPMAQGPHDMSWWIQIHQDTSSQNTLLPIKGFPERFAFLMRHAVANHIHKTA